MHALSTWPRLFPWPCIQCNNFVVIDAMNVQRVPAFASASVRVGRPTLVQPARQVGAWRLACPDPAQQCAMTPNLRDVISILSPIAADSSTRAGRGRPCQEEPAPQMVPECQGHLQRRGGHDRERHTARVSRCVWRAMVSFGAWAWALRREEEGGGGEQAPAPPGAGRGGRLQGRLAAAGSHVPSHGDAHSVAWAGVRDRDARHLLPGLPGRSDGPSLAEPPPCLARSAPPQWTCGRGTTRFTAACRRRW